MGPKWGALSPARVRPRRGRPADEPHRHRAALRHRLLALTVDYGQRHRREIESARRVAAHDNADHHVLDPTGLGALLAEPGAAPAVRTSACTGRCAQPRARTVWPAPSTLGALPGRGGYPGGAGQS
ncbi:7-cyano-7-deazaguanine synthase [Goodfellowiella coeruleoviolacea]|uniref:7-cyano-7-deazaguanine synthase n=1 Tax=Goodfellowiella coeruleoviolacea TaxID=334858 RepID=UPI0020A37FA9|nr:7-cyano-7-deazaguanine synthase [Goodfellowiella coeruleoviolacea]